MNLKVCIAGATGWAGSALCRGVIKDPDLQLTGGVARRAKGKNLSEILQLNYDYIPIYGSVEEMLNVSICDILVEFTLPDIAKKNILTAVKRGISVLVGTSGLSDQDYEEIKKAAIEYNVGVLAVGNFSVTAALLQKFSIIASKFITNLEIIDYADDKKIDIPSGTVLEMAKKISEVRDPSEEEKNLIGPKELRGKLINGVRTHSVRLPGYTISVESIFGLPDERLTIRHDAGSGAEPYVKGGLIAIKKMLSFKGLKRGLDQVIDFS